MNKTFFFLLTGFLFFSKESDAGTAGQPPPYRASHGPYVAPQSPPPYEEAPPPYRRTASNNRLEDADMFTNLGLDPEEASSALIVAPPKNPAPQKTALPQQRRAPAANNNPPAASMSGSAFSESSSSSASSSLKSKSKAANRDSLLEDEEMASVSASSSASEGTVKSEDEGYESSSPSKGVGRKNVRSLFSQKNVSLDPIANNRMKRILNRLLRQFKEYYTYFVEPQLRNDAGSSPQNPIKFKIGEGTQNTKAEEIIMSTAYAAFFCRGAPANKWVAFTTFINKKSAFFTRLGYGLVASPDDIRAITKTVTTDCGSMYGKMCLQDACQSGLCGFPQLEMLGAVCGLCHEKASENPSYDFNSRRCQIDYIDTFVKKKGSHEYNKAQRENQSVDPTYYQYGRPAPMSPPPFSPFPQSFYPGAQQPIPSSGWTQGIPQPYAYGTPPPYSPYPPSYQAPPPYGSW